MTDRGPSMPEDWGLVAFLGTLVVLGMFIAATVARFALSIATGDAQYAALGL